MYKFANLSMLLKGSLLRCFSSAKSCVGNEIFPIFSVKSACVVIFFLLIVERE